MQACPLNGFILLLLSSAIACASHSPKSHHTLARPSTDVEVVKSSGEATAVVAPIFSATHALSSQDLIKAHGSGLPACGLTDATWFEDVPIAINEPFDFAAAMMMDDIGPGLAAAKRQKSNAEKAASLAQVSIDSKTRETLNTLRAQGFHVYALLWGTADDAALRLICDHFDAKHTLIDHHVREVNARPIAGPEGWSQHEKQLSEELANPVNCASQAKTNDGRSSDPPRDTNDNSP